MVHILACILACFDGDMRAVPSLDGLRGGVSRSTTLERSSDDIGDAPVIEQFLATELVRIEPL